MSRFIEVRGGTGAGKSTLVRQVMAAADAELRADDPWVGRWTFPEPGRYVKLAVPGTYRMPTGGLENRYTLEECIGMLDHAAGLADVVLFEGGMISKTTGKVFEYLEKKDYTVIYLQLSSAKVRWNLAKRRRRKLTLAEEQAVARDHDTVERAVARIKSHSSVRVQTFDTYATAFAATVLEIGR